MSKKDLKSSSWFSWMNDKHRLVLMNDETFQEERSIRLVPANVAAIIGGIFLLVGSFVVFMMVFTPLGYIVPNYAAYSQDHLRVELNDMSMLADSLRQQIDAQNLYIENVRRLLSGNYETEDSVAAREERSTRTKKEINLASSIPAKSDATNNLIESVDAQLELGNLVGDAFLSDMQLEEMSFVSPIKGILSDTFAPNRDHFGIDIVAPKGTVIKSVKAGTVIVATWSADTGHMIGIQHGDNVISFYKHNSSLLKKMGDLVKAGEAIAIIGNTGEMTDGPHLHFELWYKGQPIDPQRYVHL